MIDTDVEVNTSFPAPRANTVQRNIQHWKAILQDRYSKHNFDRQEKRLSTGYKWHGSLGVNYHFSNASDREKLRCKAAALRDGFSNLKIQNSMFGEGNMLGNLYSVTGTHDGRYYDVPASGSPIAFFGISIARFDENGLLIEERELFDEIRLLQQIGVIKDQGLSDLSQLLRATHSQPVITDCIEAPLPAPKSMLFNKDGALPVQRDNLVIHHEKQWREWLRVKYVTQDFDRADCYLSPYWCWRATGGLTFDIHTQERRQEFFEGMKSVVKQTPDYAFTSHVFGEGNLLLYNIACSYTQTAETLGIKPTGRQIRHANIAVCQFDQQGRIEKEWEIHDILAICKQLELVANNPEKTSLLDVLQTDNREAAAARWNTVTASKNRS